MEQHLIILIAGALSEAGTPTPKIPHANLSRRLMHEEFRSL